MTWWLWLVFGLALTGLELVSAGGFYLIFFGVSALLIGTLQLMGMSAQVWVQWFLFTALSVGLLALFRNPLLKALRPTDVPVDQLVGEIAIPIDDIAPGSVGKAELRGAAWNARNEHHGPLQKGQRCRVRRVDELMLILIPE
jgi:inner membrane protein